MTTFHRQAHYVHCLSPCESSRCGYLDQNLRSPRLVAGWHLSWHCSRCRRGGPYCTRVARRLRDRQPAMRGGVSSSFLQVKIVRKQLSLGNGSERSSERSENIAAISRA